MKAKKSLGQNFLTHKGTLRKILTTANLTSNDRVVEVGPGHGVLTRELAIRTKYVTAIELDDRLIPELAEKFSKSENVIILHQDALTFTPPCAPYKVVANIPYYITSPLINHFLRDQPNERRPTSLTLLVQKEVAQKIASRAPLSVLALQVHCFGTPKIMATVPASHFKPQPNVNSAILHIQTHPCPLDNGELTAFFNLIHAGFGHKRKKLIRNLEAIATVTHLKKIFTTMNLNENTRAEELTLKDWIALFKAL